MKPWLKYPTEMQLLDFNDKAVQNEYQYITYFFFLIFNIVKIVIGSKTFLSLYNLSNLKKVFLLSIKKCPSYI